MKWPKAKNEMTEDSKNMPESEKDVLNSREAKDCAYLDPNSNISAQVSIDVNGTTLVSHRLPIAKILPNGWKQRRG